MSVKELSEELWQFRLSHSPEFSIFKGIIPKEPALDNLTVEGFTERKNFCEMLLAKAHQIDAPALSAEDAITLKIIKYYMNMVIKGEKYMQYLMPVDYRGGPDVYFKRFLLPKLTFTCENNYRYYLELLKCLAKQMNDVEGMLKEGLKKQFVVYQVAIVPAVLNRLKGIVDVGPEETFFFQPFKQFPDSISEMQRSSLIQSGIEIIQKYTQEPCKQMLEFLTKEYVPHLRVRPSISEMPGPSGRYEAMIKFNCDTDIPVLELHQIGLQAVKENLPQMKKVLQKVVFSGTMQQYRDHLRTQEDQWFNSKEECVSYCKNYIENVIRPKLSQYFHDHSSHHVLEVVMDNNNKSVAKALYVNPSADGSIPGRVLLDSDSVNSLPKYEIPVLMLHEGIPGHHMQACYILDKPDIPEFRKHKDERMYNACPSNYPTNVAYTEGWSLYCEELGKMMGLYENPIDEFGYLLHDSMRSCRVVVDTGIHALGWSKEQAVAYMLEHTALTESNIRSEVDRYICWPAQAAGYKLGHLRIRHLWKKCEQQLGASFDLREFHDICLSNGQVPLNILEELVDEYLQDKKTEQAKAINA